MSDIKLNIGCGADYRPGFINIDASDVLSNVDKVIDLSVESLCHHFCNDSIDFIVANDFIEHHFHWEALNLLKDFHAILKPGGKCEIRVPDCSKIIKSWRLSTEEKLILLFGGQDVEQDGCEDMRFSRRKYPQLFCHKYGWTKDRLKKDLSIAGFSKVSFTSAGTNVVSIAIK
ncbi:MAG: methyltransferase domain-containing protein [Desulfuromonadales bacterium]|nr:methyltransferase domain-containing protein [Desulfuromonadales bacterium]